MRLAFIEPGWSRGLDTVPPLGEFHNTLLLWDHDLHVFIIHNQPILVKQITAHVTVFQTTVAISAFWTAT